MSFSFNKLTHVVFIGYAPYFNYLIKINKSLGLQSTVFSNKSNNYETETYRFKKINKQFLDKIKKKSQIQNTIFISLFNDYVFKKEEIKKLNNNIVNFHNTRLPFHKGRAVTSWEILSNDRIHNVTIHTVNEKIDGGAVIFQKSSLLPKSITIPKEILEFDEEVTKKYYKEFIIKLLKKKKLKKNYSQQCVGNYNYALNTLKHGFIDWNNDSRNLYNFISAFDDPYKGASTYNTKYRGKLYLKKVQIHQGELMIHPFSSGMVIRHDKKWLVVNTINQGSLIIEEVLDAKGKNVMSKIKSGSKFFVPLKYLNFYKK
jgi:methionyl-tRNA formyltransferase